MNFIKGLSISVAAMLFLFQGSVAQAEVTVTDVVGRTVTLEKPATKIVGTHNPTLNTAIILGGGGKYLVGFGNKNMAGELYKYVYPELKDVPQIGMGKEINYEACLAAGAELAILPERFKDQAVKFNEVGIPAAVILPSTESYDTIKNSLLLLGKLVGDEKRAQDIVTYYDGKINSAKEIAKKANKSPKILYLGASSPLTVANGLMLQSTMIETVGGVNVAKDVPGSGDFIGVTAEDIIKWNPDIILVPVYAKYPMEDVLNNPAYSSINAIKNKQVLQFPSKLEPWDYPTPSTAMGLVWMLNRLYPELYSKEQVLKDAQEYYQLIYGQTFTAEQLGL